MAPPIETLMCQCGERRIDLNCPVMGLCMECFHEIDAEARARGIDLRKPPNPSWQQERIILGNSLWWWRESWRIDRSKAA